MGNHIINIETVINYIETHLDEKLDLEKVSEAVHYSKYYLHRMFTNTVGMTIHDYATCYSVVPLVLLIIPATAITNVLTLSEATIYTMLTSVAWVWVGILVFFGTQVTHDYSIFKNVLTCIGTIVAMGLIMFCCLLFSTLMMKMVTFVTGIVVELSYR